MNELERLAQQERWHEAAMEKAVGVPQPEPPADETSVERFTRNMREQAETEAREAARMNRLEHEHPNLPIGDEFRDFAVAQMRRRRR